MRSIDPTSPRILLCASAAHCAHVLQAAASARVHLHGLQPTLQWPDAVLAHGVVLWALLPTQRSAAQAAVEQRWREHLGQGLHAFSVQMLYGNALQQAAQLAPWIAQSTETTSGTLDAACGECLDAASEQTLFQHLLQRP